MGPGFHGFGLRPAGNGEDFDPFLSVDHFRMSSPTFPPHPHAGFSAATYLFSDSETPMVNRDSLGHRGDILAGDLHWTQAAAGLMHEEVPKKTGLVSHGLQVFVNLPACNKHEPPSIRHVDGWTMPRWTIGPAEAKLVFGAYEGQASAWQPLSNATLIEVALPTGASVALPVPAGLNAFALVIDGQVDSPGARKPFTLTPAVGLVLPGDEGDAIELKASSVPARVVVFLGRPLREPVVSYGPFTMNTEAEIVQARRDFAAGRMGRLGAG
jgi:redox-sensitive bicupin YhaK (pirin superfamily)